MNSGDSITQSVAGLAGGQSASASDLHEQTTIVVAPQSKRLARIKWLVGGAMLLLLLLPAVRLGFVSGLVRTVRIEGPSMAPALCGAHYQVVCGDCGIGFPCDAERTPGNRQVTCPNCGYQRNDLDAAELSPGERVLIDRWPLLFRPPHRHEVVAARDPTTPGDLVVKRIAALPAERLEIRGGDLFASGRIVRKSLAELRQVRVLVHDNDFQPQKTRGLPARWESQPSGCWHTVATGFRHEGRPVGTRDYDRLCYSNWRCVAGPGERTSASPILDNDSYNQAESRELNMVSDVHLTCELLLRDPDRVALFVQADSKERYAAFLDTRRREVTLEILDADLHGTTIDRAPLSIDLTRSAASVEFGLCDRQVLLAIDGRTVFLHALDNSADNSPAATTATSQLEIWADSSARTQVNHLRVWRDIYYLDPVALPRPWRMDAPLSGGQFALLGDNAPVSLDSRTWPQPGVARGHILGRVYRPFWATASTE